jgi:hypothetical protein
VEYYKKEEEMKDGIFSGIDKDEKNDVLKSLEELNEYSPLVFRLGGGIMLFNVLVSVLFNIYFGKFIGGIYIFDIIILIGLFMLNDSFRGFAVLRAFLGITIVPVYLFFTKGLNLDFIITVILQISYCVPIILLLYGKEKKEKTIIAIVIFGIYILIILLFIMMIIISKK